ncbi:C-type lectin domain family 4 member G-like [Carettochelys insculpta]|uniref:C-type lectin domain family 4 member G-like n=1 Tax=Carettochelys insculpta TaxID=44489 RepID=UPI003EB6AC2A
MQPDSCYYKWENTEQVDLSVPGESSRGRGDKGLCLSNSTQGKAVVILLALLMICFVATTALIVVRLGKLSQGLTEAQLDQEMIRTDSKINLSYLQNYLESKMSKEFSIFSNQLLNASEELAGVRLGTEEIQADNTKDLLALKDVVEIKNLTHSMLKELTEMKRDSDIFQEALSRAQEELRNIMEFTCIKCPPGWQPFEKSCYFFSTLAKSWWDAKQFCIDQGSHLVIVNTRLEQTFLSRYTIEPEVYWLGLSDSATEGEWRWLDGSPLSVRFWAPGEPNNVGPQGEDCGSLQFSGKWNDAACSVSELWICERPC